MRSLVDAGEELITKLMKGVDDWGKNKAKELLPDDAEAYRQYGRDYIKKHGNLKGHMKVNYGNEEFSIKKSEKESRRGVEANSQKLGHLQLECGKSILLEKI